MSRPARLRAAAARFTVRPMRTALLVAAALLAPAVAAAFDDPQLRLDADLGYACYADEERIHGAYWGLDVGYAFDSAWVLHGGYQWGEHRIRDASFRAHQLGLGVRYQLDVFEYVPFIDLMPVVFFTDGEGGPAGFAAGAALGLGFDYLIDDTWSIGFGARYYQLAGESRFPAYLTAGLRVGYRWTLGDPLAP